MDIKKGEFLIVPKGVEHITVAESAASIVLFEPESTINTGKTKSNLTVLKLANI